MPLVGKLFSGPIDIIGDVHGEIGALLSLLDLLGYDGQGNHAEGRRLVFLGDLGDRGPNSIAVIRLVRRLWRRQRAQCIIGNHELNLLREERKHGNGWFWGETEVIRKDKKALSFQFLADSAFRATALDFFGQLPLALERPSGKDGTAVSVVHAAWHPPSVAALRNESGSASRADAAFARRIRRRISQAGNGGGVGGVALSDDEVQMLMQNDNPARVLTSGLEQRAKVPFFAGGRLRTLERHRWWLDSPAAYAADGGSGGDGGAASSLVVIGHYWRRWMREVDARVPSGFAPSGADVFDGVAPTALLGPRRSVFCVDFAVGLRYEERGLKLPPASLGTHLAALRLPERTLHLEDGRVLPLT